MNSRKQFVMSLALVALFTLLCISEGAALDNAKTLELASKLAQQSMAELGTNKNAEGIFLLTNAWYGQVDGQGAERFRDLLSEITGCTSGKQSLLDVHTPASAPLWFALCEKSSRKIVFCQYREGAFTSQTIEAAPEKLLQVEAWKQASSGPIGPETLFQVASIGLAWSAGTPWPVLKVAGFHGELPPGINIGYLFYRYLEQHVPAEKDEHWLFFGALPKCYMDTLQVVYNTTLGKMEAYGAAMSKEQLDKYKTKGAMPCVVALKVNKAKDTCRGVVLGFSPKQVMDYLGVRLADLTAEDGGQNPVFCIARIKGSMQMAKTKPEEQMKWVVELRRFSGKAELAKKICNAGADPYAIVWSK